MAMTAATAGLIAAGISAAGSMGSVGISNAKNMRLAKYSADFQREMIQAQNEYNSPASQMARYKEAGLNPNLIYGQIGEGNQTELAKYNPPQVAPVMSGQSSQIVADAVNQYMAMRLKRADLELRHQQLENLKEEQFRIRADRHAQDIENRWKSVLYGFDPGLVKMAGEDDAIQGSVGFKRYDAELKSLESLTEYRNAQKAYVTIQKEVAGLNKEQQRYYIDNIQPLIREIMDKKSKGLDSTNEILQVQAAFARADKWVHYGEAFLSAVSKFINPMSGMGGSSAMGPYTGFNPSYTW